MKRSTDRILTSHVGSLPRSTELRELATAKDEAQEIDQALYEKTLVASINDIVRRQLECGLDVINDGEHSKGGFSTYASVRLSGIEEVGEPAVAPASVRRTKDVAEFPAVYEDLAAMFRARSYSAGGPGRYRARRTLACTSPIGYVGQAEVAADIANLKAAMAAGGASEGFMTAIAPTNAATGIDNRHYASVEDFHFAIAEALHEEYQAITDAGIVLQIDDPRMATYYLREQNSTVEDARRFIAHSVEVINRALEGIPREMVRFHTCYSINIAPRTNDLELRHFIDLLVKVNAAGFSFEASNPRHEHEWELWRDVKLLDDTVLMPGVVTHCSYLVEHPELVAQRIVRFADVVGKENVIAANDCGFATSAAGDEPHPDLAWAKLQALAEGAELASSRLWGRA